MNANPSKRRVDVAPPSKSITPDGCPVEFYRQLPYLGELDEVLGELHAGESILELGCGTGRLCQRLHEHGLRVTGVDESPDMLRHLPKHVEGILRKIEELKLPRTWDVVLLPSHLINHPSPAVRRGFVRTAFRHLRSGGRFILNRQREAWLRELRVGPLGEFRGVRMSVEQVQHQERQIDATLRYEVGHEIWTHAFTIASLTENDIERLLVEQQFSDVKWVGVERAWVVATV